ncbi:MAG: hypothetical protein QM783_02095 [Phycisphaerales bacterium]
MASRFMVRSAARGGDDADPIFLNVDEALGANGLDFGDGVEGAALLLGDRGVLADGLLESIAVEHVEDFVIIGDLHGGRAGVRVAGDDAAAEALGGDHDLLAEFTRAEQEEERLAGVHGGGYGKGIGARE